MMKEEEENIHPTMAVRVRVRVTGMGVRVTGLLLSVARGYS